MSSDDDVRRAGNRAAVVRGMLAAMRAVGPRRRRALRRGRPLRGGARRRTDPLLIEELVPLWRAAVKQFGRGTLGLHVGAAIPQETLLDYLAGASPNLRAALDQIARYIGLATRNVRWVVGAREADGLTTFEEQATFGPVDDSRRAARVRPRPHHEPPQARGSSGAPREVWFAHPAAGSARGVPRRCSAARCASSGSGWRSASTTRRWTAPATPPRSAPVPHPRVARRERVLAETPLTARFRERVRREVVQRLREGEPGIGGIAQALATSERSLQRKLQAEGISFRDVVDEARHKLAVVYLGDTSLSMTDVACLLGYSEAAAFTRAFKRWTGPRPSQARG